MPALLAVSAGDGLLLSTHLMLPVTISAAKCRWKASWFVLIIRADFPLVVITHGPPSVTAMRSSAISCTSSAIAWNNPATRLPNPPVSGLN